MVYLLGLALKLRRYSIRSDQRMVVVGITVEIQPHKSIRGDYREAVSYYLPRKGPDRWS